MTYARIRLVIAKIIQRKREHNAAVRAGDKRKLVSEIALFKEIQTEIERLKDDHGRALVCPELTLEHTLLDMVRTGTLRPMNGGFVSTDENHKR